MSGSYRSAQVVLAQLLAQGITDVVLAPGSRSAPLALALDAAARAGRVRLHLRIDERAAGFLALGLAKGLQRCVPVVTTSGTAVGNLLPAVMEAHHAGVPLLVISADRPAELLGTGANQTTHQRGLFGVFLGASIGLDSRDETSVVAAGTAAAVLACERPGAWGPAQLNIAFGEPLVPQGPDGLCEVVAVPAGSAGERAVVVLPVGPATVVVAGDASVEVGAAAMAFAEAAGVPLIGEPSSNARGGLTALRCGRLLLAGPLAGQVERVVLFGRPTLSRPVNRLLTREDVELIVVGEAVDLPNPGHHAASFAAAVALAGGDPAWLQAWLEADRATGERLDLTLAGSGLSGPTLAAAVVAGTVGGTLALGNSMAIRDADLAALRPGPRRILANRGLSGIDGTISTAAGIALACGPVTLLCGDLSFVHDSGALAIGPGEPRPDLRIVVADDDGGAIFATLEYGDPEFAASFERVFATPTGLDLAALARGYGVSTRRVHDLAEVRAVLAEQVRGLEVIVVALSRAGRADLERQLRDA